MSGVTGEHVQGLGPAEKKRRQLAGAHLTERAEIVRRFDLDSDDVSRMGTLRADDEVSDYMGFDHIQARIIKDEQSAQATAQRRAEGSLRAHLPTAAILGAEQPAPADEMIPPQDHMYD
jgi:hypothetical protein